jgi:hypothetical protein
MFKKCFFAAIIAASVWTVGAAVSGSVNVAEVSETTDVMAEHTYSGTVSVSQMNGNSSSGNYPGTFEIDSVSREISGAFNVYSSSSGALIHTFSIEGDLDDGADGTISLPYGGPLEFTAIFSGVSFSGNTVTFTCTATITTPGNYYGKVSIFTFTGSY